MDVNGAGTAIMVAIAAALWFAYFLPTWMRRREYLDTERTATRLQQTLRVMAETAEIPDQVRVEVSARDAARTQRILLAQQRRADAIAARAVAKVQAETPDIELAAKRRRRRARRLASLLMIAATVTIGVQLWLVAAGTAGAGSWLVFTGGAVVGVSGIAVRRRQDRVGARPAQVARSRATTPVAEHPRAAPATRSWTPVALPAPLYLSRPQTQPVRPALDLAAQLREAALASEQALRHAHDAPEVVPLRPQRPVREPAAPRESPAMRSTTPSRWAAMGRIGDTDAAAPDLDEVLRRRRSAG